MRGSVIKSSRASEKPEKNEGGDRLTKAVKHRNKAQRTNKVSAARGMDIDPEPVPIAKKGAKTLAKKKIKAKGPLKVKPSKASTKAGKDSQGKLTLATMLQKPLSNVSQNSKKTSAGRGGRGATGGRGAARGAAAVQVTIKNVRSSGRGGQGSRGVGGSQGGGVRRKATAKTGNQQQGGG